MNLNQNYQKVQKSFMKLKTRKEKYKVHLVRIYKSLVQESRHIYRKNILSFLISCRSNYLISGNTEKLNNRTLPRLHAGAAHLSRLSLQKDLKTFTEFFLSARKAESNYKIIF